MRVRNPEQSLDEGDRKIADIGRRLPVQLPGTSERVAHGAHRRLGKFGEAIPCGGHQRAGSLDDVVVRRGSLGRKEGYEVAQREGTFAWRTCVDNRLLDVRRLEPE